MARDWVPMACYLAGLLVVSIGVGLLLAGWLIERSI